MVQSCVCSYFFVIGVGRKIILGRHFYFKKIKKSGELTWSLSLNRIS